MHNAGRVVADAIAEVARFARVGRHLGSVSVEFPVNQTTFSLTQCDAAGRCHHRSRWRSRRRCRQGRSAAVTTTGRHSGQGRVHIHNHNGHFNCLTLWKIKWNYLSVRNKAGRLTNGIIIANWTGQKCRRHVFFFSKKRRRRRRRQIGDARWRSNTQSRSRMSVIINSTSFFSFFGICKVFDHFL